MRIEFRSNRYSKLGFERDLNRWLKKSRLTENDDILNIHPEGYMHPIYLRAGTSDIPVFIQIIHQCEYDCGFRQYPETILDCGANIGLVSVYWANKYPKAKIIAVEPEDSNFEMLVKNTEGYKNIHPVKGGLWHRTADLVIENNPGDSSHLAFMVREADEGEQKGLPAYAVSDLMKKFFMKEIDILKMDIEGSEKEVFGNDPNGWLKKTKNLVVELHDRIRPGCTSTLFRALNNYDYDMNVKGENLHIALHTIPEA